uniref:Uncharacterized protein n=1 Tax=Coccidioides posadasii RMSCC 3488 TaxID=454284 RepID=A0A0J6F993_COCPO|nr:hypothetical protein CPAG_02178 [Coccidioides posadasii RMSCC 3488]
MAGNLNRMASGWNLYVLEHRYCMACQWFPMLDAELLDSSSFSDSDSEYAPLLLMITQHLKKPAERVYTAHSLLKAHQAQRMLKSEAILE